MPEQEQLRAVRPNWDELLPTPAAKEAFEDASAALEAGRFVRSLRTDAGLTQAQLAELISVSQARVSAIENGDGRDGPSYALLKRIVLACGGLWPFESIRPSRPVAVAAEARPSNPAGTLAARIAGGLLPARAPRPYAQERKAETSE